MKIFIITDGNNYLGLGHVYQTITLTNYLLTETNNDTEINLLTKSDDSVISLLKTTNCNVSVCSNDEEIFSLLKKANPERIIFDKLDVAPNLAKKIKQELNAKLLIFTNLTNANKYADVTVLADIGSDFKNIHKKDQSTGKVGLWGPKYWILRSEFFAYNLKNKPLPHEVKKIMMIFGGSDPSNFSSLVLTELFKMKNKFNISLVLGAEFKGVNFLNSVIEKNNSLSIVNIFKNVSNVAQMMFKHDLVLASPGLSFFESLIVGTPVIGFNQNKMQKIAYQEHFNTLDKGQVESVPSLIIGKKFIFPNSKKIKGMEIGKGINEIINEVLT